MMTYDDYLATKNMVLENQPIIKQLDLKEIRFKTGRSINIAGKEVPASHEAVETLVGLLPIEKHQQEMIAEASGNNAELNFRNYMAGVTAVTKPTTLAVLADGKKKMITGFMPVKGEIIPLEQYFTILEMLIDKCTMSIDQLYYSHDISQGVTAYLKPKHKVYYKLNPSEEFETGLFLKGTLNGIEAGSVFTRMICTNGAVVHHNSRESQITSLAPEMVNRLTKYVERKVDDRGFLMEYIRKAQQAQRSNASIAETEYALKLLQKVATSPKEVSEWIDFDKTMAPYNKQNIFLIKKTKQQAMSDWNVWDLYNTITRFASHNVLMAEHHPYRAFLMSKANYLLDKPRDIFEYINPYNISDN